MPDRDGYPTDEELETIEKWNYLDLAGWFAFIKTCWWMPDWGWHERKEINKLTSREYLVFEISTGGWSGNEEIIGAMKKNRFGWFFSWFNIRRGGHYIFKVDAGAQKTGEEPIAAGGYGSQSDA